MRKVLVVLLVLVIGGVVAADRLGVRFAQDEIGRQVATQYNLRQQPEVKIHGFPFLTQAVGGEYDQIDVTIADWTQAGVTLRDVKVEMRGIGAPLGDVMSGNVNNVTVRTATASVVVPYEVLQQRAPKEVRKIGPKGDDLQVDLSGQVLGFPVSGNAVVSVKATGKGIAITPVSANSGQIPLSALRSRLTWTVPLTNLPVGSKINEIRPTPEGLRVSATANDLRMSNLRGT
ncbi:DUF2993 domain-containing protein [Actinomadura vinacea]|uniref:DUF2993 domain-containing protein n=1 Tax=Actinomadura vinacea TaxID=115336 RepID=A0ABN3JCK4_9ACTN